MSDAPSFVRTTACRERYRDPGGDAGGSVIQMLLGTITKPQHKDGIMLRRNAAVLNTMHRVQSFFDANDVVFAEINASGARHRLDQAADDLATSANEQEASKQEGKGETLAQKVLRSALLKAMRPIVRIAQCVLGDVPELSSMTMPGSTTAWQPLMEAAAVMADVGRAHQDVFTSGGLPADFVERLMDRVAALKASFGDKNEYVSTRVLATASTASHATRGRRLVKVLDALVKLQLTATDPLLAGWQTAKRYHAIAPRSAPAGASLAAVPAVAIAAPTAAAHHVEPAAADTEVQTTEHQ